VNRRLTESGADYREFTKNNQQPSRLPNTMREGGNADTELIVKNVLKVRNTTMVIFKVCMDFLKEVRELKYLNSCATILCS